MCYNDTTHMCYITTFVAGAVPHGGCGQAGGAARRCFGRHSHQATGQGQGRAGQEEAAEEEGECH